MIQELVLGSTEKLNLFLVENLEEADKPEDLEVKNMQKGCEKIAHR